MVALLFRVFVAKENAVATLGVLYNVGEQGLQGCCHLLLTCIRLFLF